MSLSQKSRIGKRYEIVEELGGGAFSRTYLAKDTLLPGNPRRVVKKLQLTFSSPLIRKDALNRFAREAEALAKLGSYHPQIPHIFDYFEENQEFYLVQELIEGEDLSQELEEGKCLSEAEVIDLLQEVLEILNYIHQQGVIHRDIKPSNLIRRKSDKKMVMIDFGSVKDIISWEVDAEGNTIQTKAVGTAGYMPPEQLEGKPKYSSDIYALGMTAIQTLTGVSPIELKRDSQERVIWRGQDMTSEKLAKILDKMVKLRYAERYQSVAEVIDEICEIKKDKNPLIKVNSNQKNKFSFVTKEFANKILIIISLLSITITLGYLINQKDNKSQGYVKEWKMDNNLLIEERSEEAIAVFDKAIKRQQNNYVAWEYKGRTLLELERYEEAIAAFDEAIRLKPDYVTAWMGRGNALKNLGRYYEAIVSYDKVIQINSYGNEIKINSSAYEALYYKGLVLYELKWYDEAIATFNEAIRINPDYQEAIEARKSAQRQLEMQSLARDGKIGIDA